METVDKKDETLNAQARFHRLGSLLYQDKNNRDSAFKFLKAAGYSVRKATVSNQQLHPEYVEDYVGRIETGFGNCDYQRQWSKLYSIEKKFQ